METIEEIAKEAGVISQYRSDYPYDKKSVEFGYNQGAYEQKAIDDELKSQLTPDYWTRLEHQYAGMAMQGMSENFFKDYRDYCAGFGDMDEDEAKATMKDFANAMADVCYYFAHTLVEKYKKEEQL